MQDAQRTCFRYVYKDRGAESREMHIRLPHHLTHPHTHKHSILTHNVYIHALQLQPSEHSFYFKAIKTKMPAPPTTAPSPTPAARWLYTHLLGALLLSSLTPIFAAPITIDVDIDSNSSAASRASTIAPSSKPAAALNDKLHTLYQRAVFRPYWGGSGNNNGNGPRGDWWKIVLGIAGGVLAIAIIVWAIMRSRKQSGSRTSAM